MELTNEAFSEGFIRQFSRQWTVVYREESDIYLAEGRIIKMSFLRPFYLDVTIEPADNQFSNRRWCGTLDKVSRPVVPADWFILDTDDNMRLVFLRREPNTIVH